MTRKELHRLLYECGIDVQSFNRSGYKTLEHLEEDVDKREIVAENHDGKFLKSSQSVKILIEKERKIFHETGRDFGSGRFVMGECPWGTSGTLIQGETHLLAGVRELEQEQGIEANESDLIPVPGGSSMKEGVSKAYPHGIISRVYMRWYRLLRLPEGFVGRIAVPEQGVTVYHQWTDEMEFLIRNYANFGRFEGIPKL